VILPRIRLSCGYGRSHRRYLHRCLRRPQACHKTSTPQAGAYTHILYTNCKTSKVQSPAEGPSQAIKSAALDRAVRDPVYAISDEGLADPVIVISSDHRLQPLPTSDLAEPREDLLHPPTVPERMCETLFMSVCLLCFPPDEPTPEYQSCASDKPPRYSEIVLRVQNA
jgi:hypothetical protein